MHMTMRWFGTGFDPVSLEKIRQVPGVEGVITTPCRANLWGEREAKAAILEILPMVDILFVSEETSRRMFGKTGDVRDIMKSYSEEYGMHARKSALCRWPNSFSMTCLTSLFGGRPKSRLYSLLNCEMLS